MLIKSLTISSLVLITCSIGCYADDNPVVDLNAASFDIEACIDNHHQDCLDRHCITSDDIDCDEHCLDSAKAVCQEQADD